MNDENGDPSTQAARKRIMDPERVERNRRIAAYHSSVKSLVEAFADRFEARDAEILREYVFVGELGFALDKLFGCLMKYKIAVTKDQAAALADAITNFGGPGRDYPYVVPETLKSLKVVS